MIIMLDIFLKKSFSSALPKPAIKGLQHTLKNHDVKSQIVFYNKDRTNQVLAYKMLLTNYFIHGFGSNHANKTRG